MRLECLSSDLIGQIERVLEPYQWLVLSVAVERIVLPSISSNILLIVLLGVLLGIGHFNLQNILVYILLDKKPMQLLKLLLKVCISNALARRNTTVCQGG